MKKKTRLINGHHVNGSVFQPRSACPLHVVCEQVGVTDREHDVCQWLLLGKTNAEIATILGMSPRTAEKHVHQLLRKLGVENRTTAALELTRRMSQPEG
jgi:DNA-binding CsgD family transcriptional regulator